MLTLQRSEEQAIEPAEPGPRPWRGNRSVGSRSDAPNVGPSGRGLPLTGKGSSHIERFDDNHHLTDPRATRCAISCGPKWRSAEEAVWVVGDYSNCACCSGLVLRRWLERRRRSEGLRLKLQALALHQGLRRAGLSLEDLERIEDRATRRRRWFLGQ